ncbi:MAG: type II secretion system protein [Patescibacteria group bacterium]
MKKHKKHFIAPHPNYIHSTTGFTLVEAFFVMLIITVFTSLTLGYLQKVRQEARDVKRLADLGQVRAALELYAHPEGVYPLGKYLVIGSKAAQALDHRGWVASPEEPLYLLQAPFDPLTKTNPPCVRGVVQPCAYSYTNASSTDYSIRFYLEHGVPPLSAPGTYQLTSRGYRP